MLKLSDHVREAVRALLTAISIIATRLVGPCIADQRQSWRLGRRRSRLLRLRCPLLDGCDDLRNIDTFAVDVADPGGGEVAADYGGECDGEDEERSGLAAPVAGEGGQELDEEYGEHRQVLELEAVQNERAADGFDLGRRRWRRDVDVSLLAVDDDGVAEADHEVRERCGLQEDGRGPEIADPGQLHVSEAVGHQLVHPRLRPDVPVGKERPPGVSDCHCDEGANRKRHHALIIERVDGLFLLYQRSSLCRFMLRAGQASGGEADVGIGVKAGNLALQPRREHKPAAGGRRGSMLPFLEQPRQAELHVGLERRPEGEESRVGAVDCEGRGALAASSTIQDGRIRGEGNEERDEEVEKEVGEEDREEQRVSYPLSFRDHRPGDFEASRLSTRGQIRWTKDLCTSPAGLVGVGEAE